MKYFLDTEFWERGREHPIQIISLALLREDGRECYLINNAFDWAGCDSEWLHQNVRPNLKPGLAIGVPPSHMVNMIMNFLGTDPKPEFYGYFCDYDWVIFCQLFGRMIDLPKQFPYFCMDLKQMMVERGLTKEWKDQNCPDPVDEHNALADAWWNKRLYDAIEFPLPR
jgi:hypothetical protein